MRGVQELWNVGNTLGECLDGRWRPLLPVPGPFIIDIRERLSAAWAVFKRRAVAVRVANAG